MNQTPLPAFLSCGATWGSGMLRMIGRQSWAGLAFAVALILASADGAKANHGPGANNGSTDGSAVPTTIYPAEWSAFKERFIAADGRVVDIEKAFVSHSEGQGYGLVLAVQADDRPTFDRILRFTLENMSGRRDNLTSWLYDERTFPAISDTNNASDGDIMIAYGLIQASLKWDDRRYLSIAAPIVDDIGRLLLHRNDDMVLLRPAAFGFDQRQQPDGPVVNLSYYVYGALLLFAEVNDRYPFFEAWQDGLKLTERAIARSGGHAPDWITAGDYRVGDPADSFEKRSSYDAVRIPLYMVMGGRVPTSYLEPFDRSWNLSGFRAPLDVDLTHRRLAKPMNDPGYLTIAALTGCAVRGTAIPASLQEFRITSYFSSSLHLMALSAARRYYPQCVHGDAEVHSARSDGDAPAEPTTTVFAGSARPSGKLTLDELPGFGRVPIEASRGRSTAFPAAYNH